MKRVLKWIKRMLQVIIVAAFLLIVADIATVLIFAHYRPEVKDADAIIVLGAAINTPTLSSRTMEGLKFYQQGKAKVMIFSGGRISDSDISEAQYMQRVVLKNTAPGDQPTMILEENSHSTYENLKNSRDKLPNVHSIIIVSDEFHLARAVLTAKALGFGPVYWSAPEPDYYQPLELQRYYAREVAAMIAYIPKFLRIQKG
jgi:uncharacterized SAM-binding protein YcdF (DUF218 family)